MIIENRMVIASLLLAVALPARAVYVVNSAGD